MSTQEQLIQQEVQRKTAVIVRESNERVTALEDRVTELRQTVADQNAMLVQLTGQALYFGVVVKVGSEHDHAQYDTNDKIIVVDESTGRNGCVGKIVSEPAINTENQVSVQLEDEQKTELNLNLNQFKLLDKKDGTYVAVNIDGKMWEVAKPLFEVKPGDPVKITSDSKQIVEIGYRLDAGNIARVSANTAEGVEVEDKGEKKLVQNPLGIVIEDGDKVVVDAMMVIKKLPKDDRNRYKLTGEAKITWDDIGGLLEAKVQCQQAIEWPYQHPELFSFYNMPKEKGILLYGPPGCGKSLIVRAAANAVAKIHGATALDTGYIYVKAPELLDKWVGNTEASIRSLFEQARSHYRKHGYPAILAIDEADAIMPQRGTRVSSDISDTVVPMFLGEMDGIDEAQTKLNPIVFLLTNRQDMMDQAVIRSGRVNKHIKIERPNMQSSIEVLKIHAKKIPFAKDANLDTLMAMSVAEIFSKSRLIYKVNGEHNFCFSDCLNGAILESITVQAKMNALHRDLKAGMTGSGVGMDDFKFAIEKLYNEQRGLSHNYDLVDFAEQKGIQARDMKVERCFAM